MNIVPKLNLNKHPKDCPNNSLVDARNIMFDVDQNVLCNENKLGYTRNIINYAETVLANYNLSDDTIYRINIVGSINCNKEIIYFVSYYINEDSDNKRLILIRESNVLENFDSNENMPSSDYRAYLYETPLDYHDGEIIGTFTYNRNDELILAFSEYKEDNTLNEPLRTINLDNYNNEKHTLSIIPEVRIPRITNFEYINDNWYKGQNYLFIRFKINDYDYTQWYDLHKMIYTDYWYNVDFINAYIRLMKYSGGDEDTPVDDYENKHFNFFTTHSNRLDVCSLSFNFTLNNIEFYDKYQIGIINVRKDRVATYISSDINSTVTNIIVNPKNFKESTDVSARELIYTYYNYYNVKEIENFKNKLFISNYKEDKQDISDFILNNVEIKVEKKSTVETGALDVSSYNFDRTETIQVGYLAGKRGNNKIHPFKLYKLDDNCYQTCETLITVFADSRAYVHLSWVKNDIYSNGFLYIDTNTNEILSHDGINDDTYVTVTDSLGNVYTDKLGRFGFKMSSATSGSFYYLKPIEGYIRVGNTNQKVYRNKNIGETLTVVINNITYTYNASDIYDPWVTNSFYDVSYSYSFYRFDEFDYNLAVNYDRIYNSISSQLKFKTLIPGERYNFYIHFVDKYGIATNGYKITNFNDNGILEKIVDTYTGNFYFKIIEHTYTNSKDIKTNETIFAKYELSAIVPELPEGYIGWYISYEEFEYSVAYNGVIEAKEKNLFISNEVDINDKINLNFNTIKARTDSIPKTNVELLVGGSASMIGSNTKLRLNNSESSYLTWASAFVPLIIGSEHLVNNFINIKLTNDDDFSYYNTTFKKLIPLTDTIYGVSNSYVDFVDANYNGVITCFNHIVFAGRFYYNSADNLIYKLNYSVGTDSVGDVEQNIKGSKALGVGTTEDDILELIRYYDYSNYYFESRRFRSEPQAVVTVFEKTQSGTGIDLSTYVVGTFVQPVDTIDLWENPQFRINEAYPKVLSNYVKEYNNTYIFDKTIRRSNVIADESLENSWRKFETDQYINIKENKGIIKNLCAIGNVFLVHTEHSLFQFDFNDRLTSNGGVVEVDQKDIFDSRYTELFNSELGLGGLQERRAAIAGDFGYIWYNNDFNHFYGLSKEGPKVISEDIDVRLKRLKPTEIRFGDDKQRSRLLIRYKTKNNSIETISFNYKLGCFVSLHDYDNPGWFAYSKDKIKVINNDKIRDGFFRDELFTNCQFSIINSAAYDEIKFIEFIRYKFIRIDYIRYLENINYKYLPLEGRNSLEPGDSLYVISDNCSTGQIVLRRPNVTQNDNASNDFISDYPYYELGQYNLNKLLNINDKGRLFGNYFIFTFVVNSTDNKKINFENFDCSITKLRK